MRPRAGRAQARQPASAAQRPRPEGRRGVALVMVLWVLTILALIAASFARSTRTEINLARNLVDSAKAEALAEAGVHQAILGLSGRSGAERWRVDGTVYAWLFGGGQIRVSIEDEGAKIDLNASREELLRNLFRAITFEDGRTLELTEADALVDAILDFRDEDSLRRFNGAEDADYRSADLAYDAKDEPFELLEELQQVLGMTREVYDQVAPALTVYSRRRRPFSATASDLVQTALQGGADETIGADQDLPEEAELQSEDRAEDGTLADPEVVTVEDLNEVPQVISLGPSPAQSRARVYTIHAEGQLPSGAVFALEAVTRLTRGGGLPYIFLSWRRAERTLFVADAADEETEPPE